MATIDAASGRQGQKNKRLVKKSTTVDLTPMVDLGFLLITFFVFTTVMAKPAVMPVNLPYHKTTDNSEVCESCALTVILAAQNKLYYYSGAADTATFYQAEYSNIRQVIQQKKATLRQLFNHKRALQLIVKPSAQSSFQNFVDMADEASINIIQRYYIDELTPVEINKIPVVQLF